MNDTLEDLSLISWLLVEKGVRREFYLEERNGVGGGRRGVSGGDTRSNLTVAAAPGMTRVMLMGTSLVSSSSYLLCPTWNAWKEVWKMSSSSIPVISVGGVFHDFHISRAYPDF